MQWTRRSQSIIDAITSAFAGVTLGSGITWREARVLDLYGSAEERRTARSRDERTDWSRIPDSLIGDLEHQDVLPFLDAEGLRFHLAPCMIYTLRHYKDTCSLIPNALIYTLTHKAIAGALQQILAPGQRACVVRFLALCLEIGDDRLDVHGLKEKMRRQWGEAGLGGAVEPGPEHRG